MKQLEHQRIAARSAFRRAAARLGRADPAKVEPARLVLRLAPAVDGTHPESERRLSLTEWRKAVVTTVDWLGPLAVTIIAGSEPVGTTVVELVRFAHRLECPTLLITDGTGIDEAVAIELVDVGLARARVLIGGVSDAVQRDVVGNAVDDATGAVHALIRARADRSVQLDVEVAVPWQGLADQEIRAVSGWARQIGVDGLRVLAPWRARALPANPELLDELAADDSPFNRTRGATVDEIHAMFAHQDGEPGYPRSAGPVRRRRRNCPVGGLRVELRRDGSLGSCPFKAPIGQLGAEGLAQLWRSAGPHLEAIRSCERACAHIEVAPVPILG